MLPPKLFREDPDRVRRALEARNQADLLPLVGRAVELDTELRTTVAEADGLRAEAKKRARGRTGPENRVSDRSIREEVNELESRERDLRKALDEVLLQMPNIPDDTVPVGGDDSGNLEVRRVGTPPAFDFQPKPHYEIGADLGILDIPRGVRMSKARFYVLMGMGAVLELALIRFMMDVHVVRHRYTPVIPPFLVNRSAMVGCGQLPKFEDGLFRAERDDLYLVPTAESALANMHVGEVIPCEKLPLRYVGYTPCFRRESGAAGRDTRGILRVHQFDKVELFKFCEPDDSFTELESMVNDAERILQLLELPYRVVCLSTGDMGFAAAKTYDLEVWLPSESRYREISSCSNVTDFQALRTSTRYRDASGKPRYVHMLNGSGVAVGRAMIAILENHQTSDGTVRIPKALRPYCYGLETIGKGDLSRLHDARDAAA